MAGFVNRQQEVLTPYPNGDGSKIPFHSRIGTKLIVGFLIIATITGSVGYLSLNYAQTVGEKFHLLEQQSLPTIDSLKEMKVAALNIEADTNDFGFTWGVKHATSNDFCGILPVMEVFRVENSSCN
jgi:Four helix bundle sensory module for signal transduction